MYTMKRGIYICDICGCELEWDDGDDVHGTMWGCERCGKDFCSKCFIDQCCRKDFDDMLHKSDKVLCPDCYGKEET